MALKQLIAGSFALICMLCGCGSGIALPDSGSAQPVQAVGSGDTGSADTELVDPPLEESVTQAEDAELQLSGLVICLDPGHGITAETAQERVSPLSEETKAAYVSGASGSNQSEQEVNLAVAELTRARLEQLGAQVVMTRQTEEATISNIERAEIANHAGADLCIRIHADGADDPSASGMSMQVPAGSLLGTPEIEAPSAQAAEIILQAVTESTGARSRGLAQRSDLTGFNWSEVPCILLEMGFLSNPQEDALLETEDYRQKIADGIAEGVCRWADRIR
ncbi:MAG: N-acetylmuramoyl-L-alanine amidase [Eubacteriales bacterium]|nr:N-acetylmuramoyl-L-alanine amidase [Eubacteriales bacterium]